MWCDYDIIVSYNTVIVNTKVDQITLRGCTHKRVGMICQNLVRIKGGIKYRENLSNEITIAIFWLI